MSPRFAASRLALVMLAAALTAAAGCAQEADAPEPDGQLAANDARVAFFRELSTLCGQRLSGRAVHASTPDDPMLTAPLEADFSGCSEQELRVPFNVGEDRSRTWILTLADTGLLFKHDHRHADGTPDSVTNYGGWATPEGTRTRQSFPADSFTAALIPAAATNVWTLEVDRERNLFIYDLQRHGQPRFRAEFGLPSSAASR